MKKFSSLALIGMAAYLATGCAITDYSSGTPYDVVELNSTSALHEADTTSGAGDDGFDVCGDSSGLVSDHASLLHTVIGPGPGGCGEVPGTAAAFFEPDLAGEIGIEQSEEWFNLLGSYAFSVGEAQVFGAGCTSGTWALGTVQSAACPDGVTSANRVGTVYRPDTTNFTIVGEQTGGVSAAGEQVVLGEGRDECPARPLIAAGSKWTIESIALDKLTGSQFGTNMAATTPERAAPGCFSTMWSVLGRFGEGRNTRGKIVDSAGLAEFFSGESISISYAGLDATISGGLREDGMMIVSIHELTSGDSTWAPVTPLQVALDRDMRLYEFDLESQRALVQDLANWSLTADVLDRPINVSGFIPELGITPPNAEVLISSLGVEGWLAAEGSRGDLGRRR